VTDARLRAALRLVIVAVAVVGVMGVVDTIGWTYIVEQFRHGSVEHAETLLERFNAFAMATAVGVDVLGVIALAGLANAARGPARGLAQAAFGGAVAGTVIDVVYYLDRVLESQHLLSMRWSQRLYLFDTFLAAAVVVLLIVALYRLGRRIPMWIGGLAMPPLAWSIGVQLIRFFGDGRIDLTDRHPWLWAVIACGFVAWRAAGVIAVVMMVKPDSELQRTFG
jgi:hypothetical protein